MAYNLLNCPLERGLSLSMVIEGGCRCPNSRKQEEYGH